MPRTRPTARPRYAAPAAATALAALALAAALPLAGQHEGHDQHASPYAGQMSGEVPSLSDQELADLRAGAGMGLARPAELNQFPGPKHVRELASELSLNEAQLARVADIEAAMKTAAISLGEKLIEAERHLNDRFRHGHIDEESLEAATREIADLQGRLRFVHLKAHLETTRILTPEQIERYDRLRGYSDPGR